ncbi:MAG: hypothetical protein CVT73_05835 [Alphaproteobacteria bacterium HGW-Alphaproteobacteria-12]|nr:MAG: hypothetical protein CVT73_05835 [Alphaproteobacteria bacterium HGW-Alphaproteobacteria-12]
MSVKPRKQKEEAVEERPHQKPGGKTEGTRKTAARTPDAGDITETDLASDKMGDNELQGDDQLNVRNERHAQPDVTTEMDSVMDGLKRKASGIGEK